MLPKQAISFAQLRKDGFGDKEIKGMLMSLRLFPTPFKGIYYVPLEEERGGWFIEKPKLALYQALALYLGTKGFYFSCATAEEEAGVSWHRSGEIHVVNTARSGRVDLEARSERNAAKGTYRSKKVARLIAMYARKIIFHKAPSVKGAKARQTIYGSFALPSQIKKDRKRFRELAVRPEYEKKLERLQKQKPIHMNDLCHYRSPKTRREV